VSPISPGLAQASFELLRLIGVQGLTASALIDGLHRIGGISSAEVLRLTQRLNWIALGDDGLLAVSSSGRRLLELAGYEAMLARALLDFAELTSPPWLQNAMSGRARVLAFADVGVQQMIVEAGLAEGSEDWIVDFWATLSALARGRRDDRLLAIGRQGERLSLAHETVRTGRQPHWVAIDSNEDGFDILSVLDAGDRTPLAIEVKASTQSLNSGAHITRNEWDTAQSGMAHTFHFWDLKPGSPPRLAVLAAADLCKHMPEDQGKGNWESALVPFSAFAERFGQALLA
jgi:hypothetical protein